MGIKILSDRTVSSFQKHLKSENKIFLKLYMEGFSLSNENYQKLFTDEEMLLEDISPSGTNREKPLLSEGGASSDFENSVKIFEWLKEMSLADANDKRLWITLAHMDYQDYSRTRWNITKDTKTQVLLERYYYEGSGLSSRLRNSIARLWWIPKLTYNESLEDPYEFTRIVWSSQDLMQGLFERTYGTIRSVRFGMLRFYRDKYEVYDSKEFRVFYKELNALGATKSLLLMDDQEVYTFLKEVERLYFPEKAEQGTYSLPLEEHDFVTENSDSYVPPNSQSTEETSENTTILVKSGGSRIFYLKKIVHQDLVRTPSLSRTAAEQFFKLKVANGSSSQLRLYYNGSLKRVMVNKRKTRNEYRIFLNHVRELLAYDLDDILRFEEVTDGYEISVIYKNGDSQTYDSYEQLLEGKGHTIVQGNILLPEL